MQCYSKCQEQKHHLDSPKIITNRDDISVPGNSSGIAVGPVLPLDDREEELDPVQFLVRCIS